MAWDPEISTQLHIAFDSDDVAEFKRLLLSYPEYLRDEDGSDIWMWMAAMGRKLPILQALVDLGLNVNESHERSDENNPFVEPEGPILQAAGAGDTDMVRWLLERGAKINYIVNGKPRCLPLIHAATGGHLDVVKLLVDHGADINSTWEGLNAIAQADLLGHTEISAFLRSRSNPSTPNESWDDFLLRRMLGG